MTFHYQPEALISARDGLYFLYFRQIVVWGKLYVLIFLSYTFEKMFYEANKNIEIIK
jgi:hypothetical protein